MENANTFIQEAKHLIKVCPVLAGKNAVEQTEQGTEWCQSVAQWTNELCKNKDYGPKTRKRINWFVVALQPKGAHRKKYDALVDLLLDGYKLIQEKAPADKQIGGKVMDGQNKIEPRSAADFASQARRIIEKELSHPFNAKWFRAFNRGGQPTSNPVTKGILVCLKQAQRLLVLHIRSAGVEPKTAIRFQHSEFADSNRTSEWTEAHHSFESAMKSTEAVRATPWLWLGVNMLGFCTPRRYDVLTPLGANLQQTIAIIVSTAGGGPGPAFVATIRKALRIVRDDLATGTPTQDISLRINFKERVITIGDDNNYSPESDLIWEFLAVLTQDRKEGRFTPKQDWKNAVDTLRPKIGNENLHMIIEGWGRGSRGFRLAQNVEIITVRR